MQLLKHFYREWSHFWLASFCSDYLIIAIVIENTNSHCYFPKYLLHQLYLLNFIMHILLMIVTIYQIF